MPMMTGAFSQLLAPGLRKIFFQYLREKEPQYSKIFNINSSSRAYEEDLEIVGFGVAPVKDEGDATAYVDALQGGKKRYTHVSYGLGYRVTKEMNDDDLYGPMRKMSKELGKSMRAIREVVGFNVLNNAFSNVASPQFGFTKNAGNEALITTSHTVLDGASLANRSATDADLGVSALEAAVLLFDNLTDENGIPITIMPKWLIFPPGLKQIAREILGSEYRPYTANNEINAVMQDGIQPMMVNWLTDSNSWFLVADKSDHDLNFFDRTPISFENGDDFDTGDAKYKSFQRFSCGAGDWRGLFGSQGT